MLKKSRVTPTIAIRSRWKRSVTMINGRGSVWRISVTTFKTRAAAPRDQIDTCRLSFGNNHAFHDRRAIAQPS